MNTLTSIFSGNSKHLKDSFKGKWSLIPLFIQNLNLNEAREKFGFKNVWAYDGRILFEDNNDGQKIKVYYE